LHYENLKSPCIWYDGDAKDAALLYCRASPIETPEITPKVMEAFMKMTKFDIEAIKMLLLRYYRDIQVL